jgi:hypothetical protein
VTRKTRALLLNAFLLPGLGQLYLGRKVHGIFLILFVNLLLLVALFVLMKGTMPIVAAKMTSSAVSPEMVHNAIQSVKGLAKGLLAVFAVTWGYAIFDVIRNGDAVPPASEDE